MQVTKFDDAHYRQEDVLRRVKQINEPKIELHNLSDAHVLSLVHSFHACGFDHARRKLSIKITAATSRFEESENDPSSTPCVLAAMKLRLWFCWM